MKRHIYPLLILLVLLIGAHQTDAQKIKGKVIEENNKSLPLVGVNVYWDGTTDGTITDANGAFEIARTKASSKLIFSYVGYQNKSLIIKDQRHIEIKLQAGTNIDEITVKQRIKSSRQILLILCRRY